MMEILGQTIVAITPVLVPLVVALLKGLLPRIPKALVPFIAIACGAGIDAINVLITGQGLGGPWGAALGAAGIAVREIVDQIRKALDDYDAPTTKGGSGMGMRPIVIWLLLPAIAFAACATVSPYETAVVTATTLDKKFLETALIYDRLYETGQMPAEEYSKWAKFIPVYKMHSEAAYVAIKGSRDRADIAAVVALLNKMAVELAIYHAYGIDTAGAGVKP